MAERPTIAPLLWYQDAHAALDWLEQAFGFERTLLVEDGEGGVLHSEMTLGNGLIMVVGPPRPPAVSPVAWGGRTTQHVHVQLEDGIDALCERARTAGAKIDREPADQSYGDRVFTCTDLEDHPWSFGQTVKAMTTAEMAEATGSKITGKETA